MTCTSTTSPLRGWNGTTADDLWDYIGGGKGAFNATLKEAHGRTSIADDPIAYIENMAESGILINNKNWVKQHFLLMAQNHPSDLLSVSKAWYVKNFDYQGNEYWEAASPNIPSDMSDPVKIKQLLDQFENDMRNLELMGMATQKREHLNIAYPQTSGEQREHEVRVMRDGEEWVVYVNGDPNLSQALNNTRAIRVREQSGALDRGLAKVGRYMANVYTSLSPLFVPANFMRDATMVSASSAAREDARYNALLYRNMSKVGNFAKLFKEIADFENGNLARKVQNGTASEQEQRLYDFMMMGGETGFVITMQVEEFKKEVEGELANLDRKWYNPKKLIRHAFHGIEYLNRVIEDSNRFLIYTTSLDYGRSKEETVNNAKDVTLNFNRKGAGEGGVQLARNLYLFINPAIQSLQVLGKLYKDHPFKTSAVTTAWLASGVLTPLVNSLMMSAFGGDDDKDKYWEFAKWDRRNNMILWVPGTHTFVKIPLAQEFRGFYALGDMIASQMWGGEKAREDWDDYAEDLIGQVIDMMPLDPTGYDGNLLLNLMPNAFLPIAALAFNTDFTGKSIFKDSDFNKYDPLWTKAYAGTPDFLVRMSKAVNAIDNPYADVQQGPVEQTLGKLSKNGSFNPNNPAAIDYLMKGYLGGAYTFTSQFVSALTKLINGDDLKEADVPVWSKFFVDPSERPVVKRQGDEFWAMKEEQDRTANTLSKLKQGALTSGDYSLLKGFYDSEQYAQYKANEPRLKKYDEERKLEKLTEQGMEDTYTPHQKNYNDVYKAHTTATDDFEDMELAQLYKGVNAIATIYDNKAAMNAKDAESYYQEHQGIIEAAEEARDLRKDINEAKKTFYDKEEDEETYSAEEMRNIRKTRKEAIDILKKADDMLRAIRKAKESE